MSDWSKHLGMALESGEPDRMRHALSQVPRGAMQQAIPLLDRLADDCERGGRIEEALFYRDCAVDAAPDRAGARTARARLRLRLELHREALEDAQHLLEHFKENTKDSTEALRIAGKAHESLGDIGQALAAYRRALAISPDSALTEHVRKLDGEQRKAEALRQVLDPSAGTEALQIELPPLPEIRFDPVLRDNPSMPADADAFRIDGLARHIERYGGQASPRNAITRLQDPRWRDAWDRALAATTDCRVRFVGSELGVLALRAIHHGAEHALCVERHPVDARIVTGMVQKHFLGAWHAQNGSAIRDWSEDERRASFETFAQAVDIAAPGGDVATMPCDVVAFPGIDHTLLGTGIVPAVRTCRREDGSTPQVLPSRATLHAMAIQWRYPDDETSTGFDLQAVNRLRWSAYPQPLELDRTFWIALASPVEVGTLDFAAFTESVQEYEIPALCDGRVDAILVWFDLALGEGRLSSAPDSGLRCLRPAVHGVDGLTVRAGEPVHLHIEVHETRVHARTVPAPTRQHAQILPSWYVPMLGDARRNNAYRKALRAAMQQAPVQLALDIGAGTGLLSMLAAEAGAEHVIGCEQSPAIAAVGRETLAANGYNGRVELIEKDCRALQVSEDLPERADLALFELFDCSLIGEGVLHFLAHAREHLLRAEARYLPAGARLRGLVVEYRIDRILDVDANLFNPYLASPEFVNVDASTLDYRPLTEPFDLFDFDFATAGPDPMEMTLDPAVIADGTVGALLFWFDLHLDCETTLSNAPDGDALHWKQGLQFLPEARVSTGQTLPLVARHNGSALRFQWRPDGLPEDAFSRLARLDPRWLAANASLEDQTRQLLQHCAQSPDEYRKVAAIAQRMAIDPGRYGLDPVIAERFMRLFLNAPD